jgi:hypothetical protein
MYASPQALIGKTYRQEFLLGEAEDVATLVGLVDKLPVAVPYPTTGPYLHTQDFSALEPDVLEDKYYAPGVGLVLTVANDGTTEVLQSMTTP